MYIRISCISQKDYRGLTVKWSSIFTKPSKEFWPKVPFYRKFHFILKNLANFWKSSIFPHFFSLVTFSRVFCEFLFKFWKLQSFRFQNFTSKFQIINQTLDTHPWTVSPSVIQHWALEARFVWRVCKQDRSMVISCWLLGHANLFMLINVSITQPDCLG